MKAILALLLITIVFGAAATLYQRRKDTATAQLALGTAFLIVVAITHVFESFGLLSTFRWGQPNSVGHYIDLGAALVGAMFVLSALVTAYINRDHR